MAGGGGGRNNASPIPGEIHLQRPRFRRIPGALRRAATHAGAAPAGALAGPGALNGCRSRRSAIAMTSAFNKMELMICCASRLLEDGRTVAVGTGAPCAAAMLAQRLHAPNLVILFESGGVAPQL